MALTAWFIFAVLFIILLGLDLFFQRKPHQVKVKEALIWSLIWIAAALLFNGYIFFSLGKIAAINFFTGYLIEKMLSVDNLFVFVLIFTYFQTPPHLLHKVLFWGILGAIIFRALFIVLGLVIIEKFHPVIYLFGLFLIYTGIKLGFEKNKSIHPEKNFMIRSFRYFFPMTQDYVGEKFWIRQKGKLYLTPLFLVLVTIESSDILFAIDSIPAILAITYDPFIIFTSNIFAILGLRSLFFLLSHSLQIFPFLHYGVAFVLVFVGFKMVISDFWTISPLISLGTIFFILLVAILASFLIKKRTDRNKE